jgi:hypothetical protein
LVHGIRDRTIGRAVDLDVLGQRVAHAMWQQDVDRIAVGPVHTPQRSGGAM